MTASAETSGAVIASTHAPTNRTPSVAVASTALLRIEEGWLLTRSL